MEDTNFIHVIQGWLFCFLLYFSAVQLINKLLNCEIDSVIGVGGNYQINPSYLALNIMYHVIFDSSHKNVCKIN